VITVKVNNEIWYSFCYGSWKQRGHVWVDSFLFIPS